MNYTIKINLAPELDVNKFNSILELLKKSMGNLGGSIQPINVSDYEKAMSKFKQKSDTAFDGLLDDVDEVGDKIDNLKDKVKGVDDGASNLGSTFQSRMATFGLAVQGIQQVVGSLSGMTAGYIALDTATQSMKALGVEASAMADNLRDASIAMSFDVPFAAADLQGAMTDALASGVQGGEEGLKSFALVASKLAVGGIAELGDVVKGLGSTLNAFGESSEAAGEYADTYFNIVNFGVTTVAELNQYMSGVTPTAAAMGLAFDKVGGSLALMTQKGVPTASAVTKLNALLLEMAKPTAGITEALSAAGISLKDFHQMIKDDNLLGAMQELQTGFDKTGKSATAMFSSSEAGAAFNVLMGDVGAFKETLDSVSNTTGSTQFAYEQMADSIGVKTAQLKAIIDSVFIKINDVVGPAFSMIISSAQQLAPVIMSIQGIGAIIPDNAVGNIVGYSSAIVNKLIPGLLTTDAITGKTVISTNALSMSNLKVGASQLYASAAAKADVISKGVQALATKAATLAQTGLNAAFLASPIGWIVAGVAALAGTMYLLYENVEPVRKAFDTGFNFIKNIISSIIEVIGSIGGALIPIGQLIFDLWISPFEIMWGIISNIGSAIGSLIGSFIGISGAISGTERAIKGIQNATQAVKEKIDSVVVVVNAMRAGFESMVKSGIEVVSKLISLDFSGAVSAFTSAGDNAGKAYSDSVAKQLEGKDWQKSGETISKLLAEKPAEIKIKTTGDPLNDFAAQTKANLEQMQQRANEYSGALSSQANIYDNQKKRLEELEIQMKKTNDPKQKDELLQKYNEESEALSKNKEALVKGFIDGSKSGLVTEETISKISKALKISDQEARELVVKDILLETAKSGEVTEQQIKKISEEHKVTEQRVQEILAEQKKVTQETKDTDKAAKGWGDSLSDIKKRQQEAKEAMLQAKLEFDQGKISAADYNKKIKDGNEQIKQSNNEIKQHQRAYNSLKRQGLIEMAEYSEKEQQATKEKKNQYQIELENFNRKNETIKKLGEQESEELRFSRLKEGIILNEMQLNQEKLKSLKELSVEAERQIFSYQSVFNEAKKQYDIEAKKNKISEQTSKNYEDAKMKLEELSTAQLKAKSNVIEFEAQIKINAEKKEEEIKKIKREMELSEIDLKIKANIATDSDKIRIQIKNLNEDLNDAIEQLNVETDPLEQTKLVNTINKITAELGGLNRQIFEGEITDKINKIEDLAERTRQINLRESEKTLKEDLKNAGTNTALLEKAYLDHIKRKLDIDQQYLAESVKLEDIALKNAQQFMQGFAESLISTQIDPVAEAIEKLKGKVSEFNNMDEREADTKAIEEEEKALIESYKRRELSTKEFNDKLLSINKKKQDSEVLREGGTSRIVLELQQSVVNSLGAVSKNMQAQAGTAAEKMRLKVAANLEKLKEEGKSSSATLTEIFDGATGEMANFAYSSVGSAVAGFGALLAAGEDFGTAFRKGILVNLLQTAESAILTYIPQIYAAFLGWMGPIGLVAASGAIGVVYAALGVAKAELGRKTGEVDIKGKGTTSSDDNVRFLSVGESVLKADATSAPYSKELYQWQNKTGGSPLQYFTEVNPKPFTSMILKTIENDERINQVILSAVENSKMIDRINTNTIQNDKFDYHNEVVIESYKEINTNRMEMLRLIDETRNVRDEVKKGNYLRKDHSKVELDISVNDKEIINRVHQQKYDKVRGR